jgi:hypothetical protein
VREREAKPSPEIVKSGPEALMRQVCTFWVHYGYPWGPICFPFGRFFGVFCDQTSIQDSSRTHSKLLIDPLRTQSDKAGEEGARGGGGGVQGAAVVSGRSRTLSVALGRAGSWPCERIP